MNTARVLAYASCLVLVLGCAAPSRATPVDAAQEAFLQAIARDWNTYEVTDHREPRADRKAFYTRVLQLPPANLQRVSAWRELTVRQDHAAPSFHLGVAELEFANAAQARAFAQPATTGPRYLAELKVLTQYVAVARDKLVVVLYSESHQRPEVARFLKDVTQGGERFWQTQ